MTKAEWKSLTPKQRWDCLVALRGPDVRGSEAIKHFTTGVIRSVMGAFIRVGGQTSDLGVVVLPTGRAFYDYEESGPGDLRPDMTHFVQHNQEAADILGIPVVKVPTKVWEAMALSYTASKGQMLFLSWAEDNHKDYIAGEVFKDYIEPKLETFKQYLGKYKPMLTGLKTDGGGL